MRYLLVTALTLAWALWFGGQFTLVILVITLFRCDHATAVRAGPVIFHVFERYQLILASVSILAAASLLLLLRRRLLLMILACLSLAGIGSIISVTTITPPMEQLWRQNRSDTPEFHQLHRRSSLLYRVEMVLLLAAGAMLPAAWLRNGKSVPASPSSDA